MFDTMWKKVSELKVGMKIAVPVALKVNASVEWDEIVSIKKVGRERVWDIEIEGTHNFVGNGILAHNTYIESGNVGIGTTNPGALLELSSAGLTSGKALNIAATGNGFTSGNLISAGLTQAAATGTSVSGDIAAISFSPTYSTAITTPAITGQVLDISRSVTTNTDFASTLTLSGALAVFSDTATQTQGTLTSTADVVQISQNYSSNTGSALNITSAGTAGGFALRVNDNGTLTDTTPFVVDNSGNVGIGTTNPGAQLDLSTDDARKLTTTGWSTGSDIRIKTNVQTISNALEIINSLRPVQYHYTSDFLAAHPSVKDTDYYNFIAQEYQQVFPDSVTETDGLLYLNSSNMIPYAIAGIKEMDSKVASLSGQMASSAELAKLSSRVDVLEQNLLSSLATDSANLAAVKDDLVIEGKLTVLGKTLLADLGVTGKLTVGLLTIDGLTETGASISTLSGPLKLQELALGNLEIMGGKIVMDTKGNVNVAGNITSQGTITAKKYNLDLSESSEATIAGVLGSSAGKAEIPAGQTEIEIKTTALTENSLIFATPESTPAGVASQKTGENSFKIKVDKALTENLKISWWIIN